MIAQRVGRVAVGDNPGIVNVHVDNTDDPHDVTEVFAGDPPVRDPLGNIPR